MSSTSSTDGRCGAAHQGGTTRDGPADRVSTGRKPKAKTPATCAIQSLVGLVGMRMRCGLATSAQTGLYINWVGPTVREDFRRRPIKGLTPTFLVQPSH
jgi:hypothetical protein